MLTCFRAISKSFNSLAPKEGYSGSEEEARKHFSVENFVSFVALGLVSLRPRAFLGPAIWPHYYT